MPQRPENGLDPAAAAVCALPRARSWVGSASELSSALFPTPGAPISCLHGVLVGFSCYPSYLHSAGHSLSPLERGGLGFVLRIWGAGAREVWQLAWSGSQLRI